jgi:Mrp family chromosome partitioning ATPase
LPLLSAAPIVVDVGSFDAASFGETHFDVAKSCQSACDAGVDHRVEPAAERSVSRPHVRRPSPAHAAADADVSSPLPRPDRRPAARPALRESEARRTVDDPPAFDANAFSVDTFGGGNSRAASEPKPAQPQPVMTPRQPASARNTTRPMVPAASPAIDRANLCHRACTAQFSNADAAAHDADDPLEPIDDADFAAEQRTPAVPALPHAPHVDGVAYRSISAPPAATLPAGYEVDAFRWSPTVAGLAGRATTALSSLVDELVDASSSGRGVIMFAGECRGAGTTTLSAYAARRLAELGLSVVLVDADFAKPTLGRSLGVAVDFGWDDALETDADVSAALIASLDDGVSLLPLRRAVTSVNGAKAARLAADLFVLRQNFALVIVDGGPLADTEAWLGHAPEDTIDCGIVVRDVRQDSAHRTNGRSIAPSASYPAIGVVENFVRETHTH